MRMSQGQNLIKKNAMTIALEDTFDSLSGLLALPDIEVVKA